MKSKTEWVTTKIVRASTAPSAKEFGIFTAKNKKLRRVMEKQTIGTKLSYVDALREKRVDLWKVKDRDDLYEMQLDLKASQRSIPIVDLPRSDVDPSMPTFKLRQLLAQKKEIETKISKISSRIFKRVSKKDREKACADFDEQIKTMQDMMPQVELSIDSETRTVVSRLLDTLDKNINVTHKFDFASAMPDFSSFLLPMKNMSEKYPVASAVVAFGVGVFCYAVYHKRPIHTLLMQGISVFMLAYNAKDILYWLDYLTEGAAKLFGFRAQAESSDDFESWIELVGEFITGALMTVITGQSIKKADASLFFRSVTQGDRACSNIQSGLKRITELLSKISEWITGKLGTEDPLKGVIKTPREKYPAFFQLYDKVQEFKQMMHKTMSLTIVNAVKGRQLLLEIDVMISNMDRSRDMDSYRVDLRKMKDELMPLVKLFDGAGYASCMRYKPIWINFFGQSSVGKTTMLKALAERIFFEVATDEEWAEFKANRNSLIYAYAYENDFWDDYSQQWCTVIDELGMVRDVAGVTTDGWMSLVRMINIFKFPTHQAELNKKGRIDFVSRLVLTTTNRSNVANLANINHMPAIHNRCVLNLEVSPQRHVAYSKTGDALADDRSNWSFDYSKAAKRHKNSLMTYELDFRISNMATGHPVGGWFSFDELVDRIVAEYKKAEDYSESIIKNTNMDFDLLDAIRIKKANKTKPIIEVKRKSPTELKEIINKKSFANPLKLSREQEKKRIARMEKIIESKKPKVPKEPTRIYSDKWEIPEENSDDDYETSDEGSTSIDEEPVSSPSFEEINAGVRGSFANVYDMFQAIDDDEESLPGSVQSSYQMFAEDQTLVEDHSDAESTQGSVHSGYNLMEGPHVMLETENQMEYIREKAYSFAARRIKNVISDELSAAARCLKSPRELTKNELDCVRMALAMEEEVFFDIVAEYGPVDRDEIQKFVDYIKDTKINPNMEKLSTSWIEDKTGLSYRELLTTATAVIGLAGSILLLVYGAKKWYDDDKTEGVEATHIITTCIPTDLTEIVVPQSGKPRARDRFARSNSVVEQIETTNSVAGLQTMIISSNTLYAYVYSIKSKTVFRAHVQAVCDNIFVSPKHYYRECDDEDEFKIYDLDGVCVKSTTVGELLAVDKDGNFINCVSMDWVGGDAIAFKIPKIKCRRNIVNHFVDATDDYYVAAPGTVLKGTVMEMSSKGKFRCYIQKPANLTLLGAIRVPDRKLNNKREEEEYLRDKDRMNDPNFVTRMAVSSNVASENGSCGLPYFTEKGKIFGIHIAGGSEGGVAMRLCKQDIEQVIKMLGGSKFTPEPAMPKVLTAVVNNVEIGTQHETVGLLPFSYNRSENNIVRSDYHEVFSPVNVPANVTVDIREDGTIYDPLAIYREGVRPFAMNLAPNCISVAANHYRSKLLREMETPDMGRVEATYEQAVAGIPGVISGIPRSTSPGYPYTEEKLPGGKKPWLGSEQDVDFTSVKALELRAQCDLDWTMAGNGIRPLNVFKDSTKVELRPSHKNPRMINAYSQKGTINCRRSTLAFVISFMKARLKIGSALGINVHSEEWESLYQVMCSLDVPNQKPNKSDADFGGYDKRKFEQLVDELMETMTLWYGDRGQVSETRRNLYLMDLKASYHVVNVYSENKPQGLREVYTYGEDGNPLDESGQTIAIEDMEQFEIDLDMKEFEKITGKNFTSMIMRGKRVYVFTVLYRWRGGTPSGHPLTTIANIHDNHIITGTACIQSHFDKVDINFSEVEEAMWVLDHVVIVAFGDDHLVAFSDELGGRISFRTLQKWIGYLGMDYTPAAKDESEYDHKTIEECTFLKRDFFFNAILKRHTGRLPLDVIRNIVCWRKKKESNHIMKDRIDDFVKELSYYEEEVFKMERDTLLPRLQPQHMPTTVGYLENLSLVCSQKTEYF